MGRLCVFVRLRSPGWETTRKLDCVSRDTLVCCSVWPGWLGLVLRRDFKTSVFAPRSGSIPGHWCLLVSRAWSMGEAKGPLVWAFAGPVSPLRRAARRAGRLSPRPLFFGHPKNIVSPLPRALPGMAAFWILLWEWFSGCIHPCADDYGGSGVSRHASTVGSLRHASALTREATEMERGFPTRGPLTGFVSSGLTAGSMAAGYVALRVPVW